MINVNYPYWLGIEVMHPKSEDIWLAGCIRQLHRNWASLEAEWQKKMEEMEVIEGIELIFTSWTTRGKLYLLVADHMEWYGGMQILAITQQGQIDGMLSWMQPTYKQLHRYTNCYNAGLWRFGQRDNASSGLNWMVNVQFINNTNYLFCMSLNSLGLF